MKIVCGTDFSEASNEATRLAGALAKKLGDSLLLVNVFRDHASWLSEPDDVDDVSGANGTTQEAHVQRLLYHASLMPPGVEVDTLMLNGNISQLLENVCDMADNVRFLVVGEHRPAEASERRFPTAVTKEILRTAHVPVLSVGGATGGLQAWVAGNRPLRVMVAVNDEASSQVAAQWLGTWRRHTPMDITFVHAYLPDPGQVYGGFDHVQVRQVENNLRQRLGHMPGKGKVRWLLHPGGWEAGKQIAQDADGYDLLVVGSHQAHAVIRWLTGSMAEEIIGWATTPTLFIPEHLHTSQKDVNPSLTTQHGDSQSG